jgi:hypothetical protein
MCPSEGKISSDFGMERESKSAIPCRFRMESCNHGTEFHGNFFVELRQSLKQTTEFHLSKGF